MAILDTITARRISPIRLIQSIYRIRVIAFAYCFALCWLLIFERGYGIAAYSLAALHFLGLPHLLYLRSQLAINSRDAEMQHLLLDSLLFGAWIGAFGFPVWFLFSGFLAVVLANVVNTGIRGFIYSVIAFSIGAAGLSWLNGFDLQLWTSPLLAVLCLVGVFVYTCTLGVVVYLGAQRLISTRRELRDNEMRFRLIAENAGDLIALFDTGGRTLYSSPSYERILGIMVPPAKIDVFEYVHGDDSEKFHRVLTIEATGTKATELRYRMIDAEGRTLYFKAKARAFVQEGDLRVVLVSTDVTLAHEHDKQKRLYAEVMQSLGEAVLIWDSEGIILSVNKAYSKLTGYESEEVIGQPESKFRHALQPSQFYEKMDDQLEAKGRWRGTGWARRKNGTLYKERRTVSTIIDNYSSVALFVAIFFQIDKGSVPPQVVET